MRFQIDAFDEPRSKQTNFDFWKSDQIIYIISFHPLFIYSDFWVGPRIQRSWSTLSTRDRRLRLRSFGRAPREAAISTIGPVVRAGLGGPTLPRSAVTSARHTVSRGGVQIHRERYSLATQLDRASLKNYNRYASRDMTISTKLLTTLGTSILRFSSGDSGPYRRDRGTRELPGPSLRIAG